VDAPDSHPKQAVDIHVGKKKPPCWKKETSKLEKEVMKKQFSFILSDISGVLWRKKAFDFYKLCNLIMMTALK